MTRLVRTAFCFLLFFFMLLQPVPAFCDAERDAVQKAALEFLHKQPKFQLETSILGYTLIRHTPGGDLFIVNDMTGNAYFLFPTAAIPPELKKMLRESYLEGKFIKLNGLVVTFQEDKEPGTKKTVSGFYIDEKTSYEWADPAYQQTYAKLQLEQKKQDELRDKARKHQATLAKRKKNDPAHADKLRAKARALKEKRKMRQARNGAPPQ